MKGYEYLGVNILDLIPEGILKMLQDFVLTDMDADNQMWYLNNCDYEFHFTGSHRDRNIIEFSTLQSYDTEEAYASISIQHVSGDDFVIKLPIQSVYGSIMCDRNSKENKPKSGGFKVIRTFDIIKLLLYLLTHFDDESTDIFVMGRYRSFSVKQFAHEYIRIIADDPSVSNQANDMKLLFDTCSAYTDDIVPVISDFCAQTWTTGFMLLHDVIFDDRPNMWYEVIHHWIEHDGIDKIVSRCQSTNQIELLMLVLRETKDSGCSGNTFRL